MLRDTLFANRSELRSYFECPWDGSLFSFLIPSTPQPAAFRYVFAAVCSCVAILVRIGLAPVLKAHSPFLIFTLAVAVSAVRGVGPGMLATIIGAAASLFISAANGRAARLDTEEGIITLLQLGMFLLIGVVQSWLGGTLRRLRWDATRLSKQRQEILHSISDCFEAFDSELRCVYLNPAACALAQCSSEAAIGSPVWTVHPDWASTIVESEFRRVLNERTTSRFEHFSSAQGGWFEFHVHPAAETGGITVYFADITERKRAEDRLKEALAERDRALEHVRVLSGLVRICSGCKKIRDEEGHWQPLESYISARSSAQFSHGMCMECARRYFPDLNLS